MSWRDTRIGDLAAWGSLAALIALLGWLAFAAAAPAGMLAAACLAAVLALCALLTFHRVLMPMRRMSGAMQAIAAGDYATKVPDVERQDHIGQMARALATIRTALLELKSAQSQAEAASRHKSDFIANMSHELRTPLNAIIGLSDMLLEDAGDPDPGEYRESLPRIGAAARHLLSLINEILDLSRIEAGRMSVEISSFRPAALAEESLATVAPMARQKGLKCLVGYPPDLPLVESDPGRVRQILINLLGNAIKFTDAGEVRIEVAADGEKLRFLVSDTGPGIAPGDIGRLFQDFTQLDASSTRKFGGSGLGLALSRRLARLIGGDVTLARTAATGSTFLLELPLVMARPATDGAGTDQGITPSDRESDGGAGARG